MDTIPATPSQLMAFQKGAACRYAERKIEPERAAQLFGQHIDKLAHELVDTRATRLAAAIKRTMQG